MVIFYNIVGGIVCMKKLKPTILFAFLFITSMINVKALPIQNIKNPNTGDHIVLYVSTLVISLIVFIGIIIFIRKKKSKK